MFIKYTEFKKKNIYAHKMAKYAKNHKSIIHFFNKINKQQKKIIKINSSQIDEWQMYTQKNRKLTRKHWFLFSRCTTQARYKYYNADHNHYKHKRHFSLRVFVISLLINVNKLF